MTELDPRSVAIGVPCHREAARIPALAAALRALAPAPGALLAVDDGSGDGSEDLLRRWGFDVQVHASNLGLGQARNALWRRAAALGMQAIAFLDADVLPPPGYLSRPCDLLSDSALAGVGGRNVDQGNGGLADTWRGRFWPQDLGPLPLPDAPMLVGACSTWRIAALLAAGGFDPAFRTHGEDVEIGRRMRRHGLRMRYDPEIVVAHLRHDTEASLLRGCYLHCREGMRATVAVPGPEPRAAGLVLGMARKGLRAPAAAIWRRRDPAEALLGVAACSAGLLGYVHGWFLPSPGSRR